MKSKIFYFQYILESTSSDSDDNLFIIKKANEDDPMPTKISPIHQSVEKGSKKIENILSFNSKGKT